MKLPEFDLEKYNSSDTEQHRIKILSEYLIEYLKNNDNNYNLNDIVLYDDNQLEDLYFMSQQWIWNGYVRLYSNDVLKHNHTEDLNHELQKEVTKKLAWTRAFLYNKHLDNFYLPLEREKLGYKVFVAFKRLITEFNTVEVLENDYSGKSELSSKEKLIILDKLGIVKFLTEKLQASDNATHLAEILQAITGIDNQKNTLIGYCNYLIRSDQYHRNSPYYSDKTKQRANEIYNKFKIKDKTD